MTGWIHRGVGVRPPQRGATRTSTPAAALKGSYWPYFMGFGIENVARHFDQRVEVECEADAHGLRIVMKVLDEDQP
jgi:hypothetical protein